MDLTYNGYNIAKKNTKNGPKDYLTLDAVKEDGTAYNRGFFDNAYSKHLKDTLDSTAPGSKIRLTFEGEYKNISTITAINEQSKKNASNSDSNAKQSNISSFGRLPEEIVRTDCLDVAIKYVLGLLSHAENYKSLFKKSVTPELLLINVLDHAAKFEDFITKSHKQTINDETQNKEETGQDKSY